MLINNYLPLKEVALNSQNLRIEYQVLFGASICERLLADYSRVDFEDHKDFIDKTFRALRKALDYIWHCLELSIFDEAQLLKYLCICENIDLEITDEEIYLAEGTYIPCGICCLLRFCIKKDFQELLELMDSCASILSEGVDYRHSIEEGITKNLGLEDHFIVTKEYTQKSEEYVILFVSREVQKEKETIRFLHKSSGLTRKMIEEFRQALNLDNRGMLDTVERFLEEFVNQRNPKNIAS
jgi:hypothetical protein